MFGYESGAREAIDDAVAKKADPGRALHSDRFTPLHAEYVVDVWRWQVAAEVQAAKTLRRKLLAEAQSPNSSQTLLKLLTALDSLSFSERCDSFKFRGIPDENSAGSAKDNGGAH